MAYILTPEEKEAYARQHKAAQRLYDYAKKEKAAGRMKDDWHAIIGFVYLGTSLAASTDYCIKNGIEI